MKKQKEEGRIAKGAKARAKARELVAHCVSEGCHTTPG